MQKFNEMTNHEKAEKTIKDLKKRKEKRARKLQRDLDDVMYDSVYRTSRKKVLRGGA